MKVNRRMHAKISAASADRNPRCHKPLTHSLVLLGLLSTLTSRVFAQAPPLNFANNFFVTGDYIVAGAYNMTTSFETRGGVSYAVGTIKVPDNDKEVV